VRLDDPPVSDCSPAPTFRPPKIDVRARPRRRRASIAVGAAVGIEAKPRTGVRRHGPNPPRGFRPDTPRASNVQDESIFFGIAGASRTIKTPLHASGKTGRTNRTRLPILQSDSLDDARATRDLDDDEIRAELDRHRPRTRAECGPAREALLGDPRAPCPFASCRYSLLIDVSEDTGTIVDTTAEDIRAAPSCVLDIVDDHPDGVNAEDIAQIMGGVTGDVMIVLMAGALESLRGHGVTKAHLADHIPRHFEYPDELGEID
jgi:hypothetical protein